MFKYLQRKFGATILSLHRFEISSIPSNFQPKDTVNTMAHYTLKEDGTVGVLNETFTRQGKRNSIEGKVSLPWRVGKSGGSFEGCL